MLDRRFFKAALRNIAKREISALDIGGGSGHELSNLKKSDNRIIETTLLDMREQSREVVELGGHKFICKQIESIDNNFQDRYDFIMMLNLIEHLESPPKTLDKIYLMLNFGGILLVKTPNTNSLNRRIFQKKYWGGCHAPRHWVLFNEENFSSMAIKSGFQIVGFEYTQGSTQWAASLFGSVWIKFKSKKRILMADRLLFWPVCMIFAIFDFLTKKYFETDQMVFILKKQ
jgi:2-polyprenyl-3-methyl-5-hydroxy-6-metoxy-1,4-benzoquinol methylase